MIQSERELEDYICNHQDEFIKTLKGIYGKEKDIIFLGRQVKIGEHNIADLIYYYDDKIYHNEEFMFNERNYIIVELKYRCLIPKDLAQLSRYMNTLYDKLQSDEKYSVFENCIQGVFVSFGLDNDMQEISMQPIINDSISFINISTNITFDNYSCSYKDEYIDRLKLDERLENLYKEVS